MENQIHVENGEKQWTVVRSYQNQFSCEEAVERLMKVHMDAERSSDVEKKQEIRYT